MGGREKTGRAVNTAPALGLLRTQSVRPRRVARAHRSQTFAVLDGALAQVDRRRVQVDDGVVERPHKRPSDDADSAKNTCQQCCRGQCGRCERGTHRIRWSSAISARGMRPSIALRKRMPR